MGQLLLAYRAHLEDQVTQEVRWDLDLLSVLELQLGQCFQWNLSLRQLLDYRPIRRDHPYRRVLEGQLHL